MTTIYVIYGQSQTALEAVAETKNARLLPETILQFGDLGDANDGTHGVEPRLAVGGGGWVGLARAN